MDNKSNFQPTSTNQLVMVDKKRNYPAMKVTAIKSMSAICIALGVASIGLQIAALVIYAEEIYNYVYFAADVAGHGIWAGCFYIIAGSLGLAACAKKTKSLLVSTLVMSGISVPASIAAATLSGIAGSEGVYYGCYYYYGDALCDGWIGLEWTLMSISILASIFTITLLVLASVAVCCRRSENKNLMSVPMYYQPNENKQQQQQQPVFYGSQQQPVPYQMAYAGPQQPLYPSTLFQQVVPEGQLQPATAPQRSVVQPAAEQQQVLIQPTQKQPEVVNVQVEVRHDSDKTSPESSVVTTQ